MKILTVVGARPQFIKAAPVSRAIFEAGHTEFLLHTGQHYDYRMSKMFFDELGIPLPDANLAVGSGSHGWQIGQMMMRLEDVLEAQAPDWVLVYGDTNSTLAAALCASKLCISLAHVEAGLRSFNWDMPEEQNRVLTDRCSDLLLCPTLTAVENLAQEGITVGVSQVGDTMRDATLQFSDAANQCSTIMQDLDLHAKNYLLATIHRSYNTDDPRQLEMVLRSFLEIEETIIFPVHPRTQQAIANLSGCLRQQLATSRVRMIEPVGYFDMLKLEQNARLIMTDSGGVQKEAYFFGVPCITLRSETEWIETVKTGWNVVVGVNSQAIVAAVTSRAWPQGAPEPVFGKGDAAKQIIKCLELWPSN